MNRFIESTTGTVLFRMSRNAECYKGDKGKFEVRYQQGRRKLFFTLLDAFLFYFTIEEEAELWEKTHEPVLIETKVKLCLN